MDKKLKLTLNIIAIILIIGILGFVLYSNLAKETYKYKLDLANATIYSDENIVQKINDLKDANIIYIVFDQTITPKYNSSNAILFTQIFSYNKKTLPFYVFGEADYCTYSDGNITVYYSNRKDCQTQLSNVTYPIIMLGEIKDNPKTTIIIKNNLYYVSPTKIETAYAENHTFLEILYPDILTIESKITNYVESVSNYLQNKNKTN